MGIKYKIKRRLVKIRQKKMDKFVKKMEAQLTPEQISLYKMVEDVAKKNNSSILFDPYSSEIIISLPKILITIEHNKITIHNSKGFFTNEMHEVVIGRLRNTIYKEAHKERRKFKHEARARLMKFLQDMSKEIN